VYSAHSSNIDLAVLISFSSLLRKGELKYCALLDLLISVVIRHASVNLYSNHAVLTDELIKSDEMYQY
jgi:hypothetical protein